MNTSEDKKTALALQAPTSCLECTAESAKDKHYAPPPLGNGALSIMIDYEGVQRQAVFAHDMTPMIWWAGRRYDNRTGTLIPFGYIGQNTGTPEDWTQRLNVRDACTETDCSYGDAGQIRTEAFVHLDLPILAVRKTFEGEYTFTYSLAKPGTSGETPSRMQILTAPKPDGVDMNYTVAGLAYHGTISVLCDRPAKVSVVENTVSLTVSEGPASFFLVFADSKDHKDVQKASVELCQRIAAEGYDGLFSSHREAWQAYWDESFVELPSKAATDVYATSQYHLRISSTPWSIPTGIFAKHWDARFFAFDEFFPFMGLVGSGHLDTARKIPEFRHRVLQKAIAREYSYFGKDYYGTGARYHWETDEKGDDLTPPGFWLEHIFHMAHVALCAWDYYRFSADRDFLAGKAYPVISKCADYYEANHVYRVEDGRCIIGKCTDLERLGAARENAFMTTCSVIATFEAAAAAAETLGVDAEHARQWRTLANDLRADLPKEDGRYVPYPNCDQKSVAVFAGTFPYPALPVDDEAQLAAVEDFALVKDTYGNMYPVGNSTCVWYSGWMGVTFARLGLLDQARMCIEASVAETNCFSEVFEITTPAHHPWFTTAEGSYIQLVNETLLQSSEGKIRLLPGNGDCAFRLAAVGGVMVEARFADGKTTYLRLQAAHGYSGKLVLPDGTETTITLEAGEDICVI